MRTNFATLDSPSRRTALLFCLQILGYPIAPSIAELVGIPNALISYPIRFFVFFLALLQLRHAVRFWQKSPPIMRQCIVMFCSFWVVFYTRALYELFVKEVANSANVSVYLSFPFLVSGIPTLALMQPLKDTQLKFVREFFTIVGFACTTLFILNIVKMSPEQKALRLLEGRFGLENLNPISAGYVGAVAGLAAISFIIEEASREQRKGLRIGFGVLSAISGVAMVLLSASRAPLVAFFIGIVVLLIAEYRVPVRGPQRRRITLSLGLSVGAITLVTLVGAQLLFGLNPFGRFETAFGDDPTNHNSGTHRLIIGEQALDHFMKNPLIGNAAFINSVDVYPHNMLIEAMMAGGILAAIPLLFLGAIAILGWCKLILARKNPLLIALALIWAIASSNSGSIVENTESWGVMAVLIAYAVALPTPQKEPQTLSLNDSA